MDKNKTLVVFQDKNIRRKWFNNEWWFVIKDIIFVLTDSKDPSQYLKKIRSRDKLLDTAFKGGVQNVPPLGIEFDTPGGVQMLQCWNMKGIFRLIQSIPSKKAEPFKQWLAQVGHDRIKEIENPELAQKRMIDMYKVKGYPDSWIEKRVRGIIIRQELTEEWKNRGVDENNDFAILTNEISKATFGKTVSEYKEFKSIKKENLRDHMNDLELIFSMLGEKISSEITKDENKQGFDECKDAASRGGKVAGNARKDSEKELGRPILSSENYLNTKKKKELK